MKDRRQHVIRLGWTAIVYGILVAWRMFGSAEAQQQETIGKDGAAMVLVPAGEFTMGSNDVGDVAKPIHRVHLDAFYMDKYEVTVGQYAKFLEETRTDAPPDWNILNKLPHQKRPVVNVSWQDANTYCRWAGRRLPTEAEWEKAARGTDERTYPWGNDPPNQRRANYGKRDWKNHAALVPTGSLEDGQSPYGIYDLAGNVWEWTADWYDANYYKRSPDRNPKGPETGERKVLRGGSWSSPQVQLGSAFRLDHSAGPRMQSDFLGFRCAKTP